MNITMDNIVEKKKVKEIYSFAYEANGMSNVICRCGCHFGKEINHDERLTEVEAETLADMKELIMFSTHEKLKCPECGVNYFIKEERDRLIPVGVYFLGAFKFKKSESSSTIEFERIKALIDTETSSIGFLGETSSIQAGKNGEIVYTSFGGEKKELDLNNAVDIVSDFLNMRTVRTVHDIHELHLFLMWLCDITQDASKMHIVQEIMAPIRNRINNAGFDYFKKALCVFFCILKYPSLSTIALTKSIIFLSDLIMDCDMPSASEMRKIGATTPLDIFNSLTNSYLKRVKNELSHDSNSITEYVFRPSDHTPDITSDGKIVLTDKSASIVKDKELPQDLPKVVKLKTSVDQQGLDTAIMDSAFATSAQTPTLTSLNIKVRDQEKLDKKEKSRLSDSGRGERGGKSDVMSAIEDGTITKYIYDNIRTFDDYKRLIKFFKFYDKKELTSLMMKYEIDYLIHFIDIAYWREKMDDSEFYRLSKIIKDFIKIQTIGKRMFMENKDVSDIKDDDLDYSLMERFDFSIYDDAISMLESMKSLTSDAKSAISQNSVEGDVDVDMFDRSRYFDKIRDYKKLKNFHDSLAAQYRLMESQGLEKDSSYHKFVSKYDWLEEKGDYDGPIEVQLLRTMSDFMREGHIMMSSQAQYGAKVSRGIYLVARLLDRSNDGDPKEERRLTIGFTVDRYGFLEFDQLKGIKNAQASDRIKGHVRNWLKSKDITYNEQTTDIRYRNQ